MPQPETPPLQDDGVTELQEAVLILLERANIPEATCDDITKLIEAAEIAQQEMPDNASADLETERSIRNALSYDAESYAEMAREDIEGRA